MSEADFARDALERAIKIMGSQKALGDEIGVHQTTVGIWLKQGRIAGARKVLAIERATGVPRWELAPDLYEERV